MRVRKLQLGVPLFICQLGTAVADQPNLLVSWLGWSGDSVEEARELVTVLVNFRIAHRA